MKTFLISSTEQGPLVQVLALRLGVSKKKAKRLLDAKSVFVNGHRVWMAQAVIKTGDRIEVQDVTAEARVTRGGVLFEDENYVIFDKPAGILSNGPDSLEGELRKVLDISSLCAVHRLDRDTSGCLIFARTRAIKEQSEAVFREKKVSKVYRTIVRGFVPVDIDQIDTRIDGKEALTHLQVLSANKIATHLEVRIPTGRMHQIRKHMALIQHPVVGDKEYIRETTGASQLMRVTRQMLHAYRIEFPSLGTGTIIRAQAPLPRDFEECLRLLELS